MRFIDFLNVTIFFFKTKPKTVEVSLFHPFVHLYPNFPPKISICG